MSVSTKERGLPAALLEVAVRRDLVREGVRGSAWFLHCIGERPSGWEMRGPSFKGFLAGGAKGVFIFSRSNAPSRVAVCEAAIDALSLAAIDGANNDTAYVSTGGGWGALVVRRSASSSSTPAWLSPRQIGERR